MPIESGDKLSDLNPLWPLDNDPAGEGDNHMRLLKSIVQLDAWSRDADDLKTLTEINALYLSLTGGTLSGPLVLSGDAIADLEATTFGQFNAAIIQTLSLAGGTMTGPLTLDADPADALEAATRQYVDAAVVRDFATFQHVEAEGVGGGSGTAGSWQNRILNTTLGNDIGATLNPGTGEITMLPGRYDIRYWGAHSIDAGNGLSSRMIHDGVSLSSGSATQVANSNQGVMLINDTVVTLASGGVLAFQAFVVNSTNSQYWGRPGNGTGRSEIHAQATIERIG